MFAHCKKALQSDDCLHKTYVTQSGVYEFGPLLCRKSRERYGPGRVTLGLLSACRVWVCVDWAKLIL